jgi:hypothetical protein
LLAVLGPLLIIGAGVASLAGCAHLVHQEARVAVRRRAAPTDQAVAIFHSAQVCSFTVRDASGELHDSEERRGGLLPVDMARAVPDRPWWVQDAASGALLVTVIAMPPGRYELVGYAEAKGWQEGADEKGRAIGMTNCPHRWRLDRHPVQLPFEVRPGEVALLHVPTGTPPAPFLRQTRWIFDQIYDPEARDLVQSWKPAILRAEEESRVAFLSRIRQARDGYDVYPLCNGRSMAGVVRTEGTPFSWYGNYKRDVVESFRSRVPVSGTAATGFGGGCVEKRGAFHIYLVGQDELDAAVRSAGEWLARENLQGEVDVTVTGRFVEIGDRSMKD